MEEFESTYHTIVTEITKHNTEVHELFLKAFDGEIAEFSKYMTLAAMNWRHLQDEIMKEHEQGSSTAEKKAHVVLMAYSAITLHIMGMKVFLIGLIVPAGNLMRQVVELIALAFLCSSKKTKVLEKFLNGKYSSQKAIPFALKHAKEIGLVREGVEALEKARHWYTKYSHPTMLTFATHFPFDRPGEGLYVGACFDEEKRNDYLKDIVGRVGLAKQFSNFVDGIRSNLQRW